MCFNSVKPFLIIDDYFGVTELNRILCGGGGGGTLVTKSYNLFV